MTISLHGQTKKAPTEADTYSSAEPRSAVFQKLRAPKYAEKINGRLRFRSLKGVNLRRKLRPRFGNVQKCLSHLARSYRLRDKLALTRTPSTGHGIGHCDPPSSRTIRLDAVPESRWQPCAAICLPCIATSRAHAVSRSFDRRAPATLRDCNMKSERTYPQRSGCAGSWAAASP